MGHQYQSPLSIARTKLASYQYSFELVMSYCFKHDIDHSDEINNEELVQFINGIQDKIALWTERIEELTSVQQ